MDSKVSSTLPKLNRVAISGNLAVLFCPASNGKTFGVTIDAEDLPRVLGRGFWQVHNFKSKREGHFALYAFRNKRTGGCELLHRFLMDAQPGQFVDHRHHRTLDDRKAELRRATREQNAQNARTRRDSRTGFKGVTPDPKSGRYRARIRAGGKQVSLGHFPTAKEAADAYAEAAKENYGEFVCLESGVNAGESLQERHGQ